MPQTISLLLVEDSPEDAVLVRSMLRSAGIEDSQVCHVTTRAEAVEVVVQREFSVVLLDLSLPDASGAEAVESLVGAAPTLPIVVLTGSVEDEQAQKALHCGAEDYLLKTDTDRADRLLRSLTFSIERKRSRLEIARLEQHLLQSQRLESLELLAGGVAHDFNNLLVGILGNASLALADLPPAAEVAPMLREIERSALVAADLTRQLLTYSGKGRFIVDSCELADLFRDTRELLRAAMQPSTTLRFDFTTEPTLVRVDSTQIRQALLNVVTNASESLPNGHGVVSVSVQRVELDYAMSEGMGQGQRLRPGSYVVIEVADTGRGMDETTQARVFDPFFSSKYDGRGLGLTAAFGIARGHHGGVDLVSTPDSGTTVRIYLPIAEAHDPKPPRAFPVQSEDTLVLVVDDSESVRSVAERVLIGSGYEVMVAMSGEDAVQIFKRHEGRISLVVLDLTLPGQSGLETLQAMRVLRDDICVLLMSGYDQSETMDLFVEDARISFLEKPFRPETLLMRSAELTAVGTTKVS